MKRDPGLAFERTQLAWQRYALGVAVVAILSLRAGLVGRHEWLAFPIACVLAGLAVAVQLEGPRLERTRAVQLALAASLLAAAGALVLAIFQ